MQSSPMGSNFMPSVSTAFHKDNGEAKREVSFSGPPSLRDRQDFRSRSAKSKYHRDSRLRRPHSAVLLLCVLATVYLVLRCSVASSRHARRFSSFSGDRRSLSDEYPDFCEGEVVDDVFEDPAAEEAAAEAEEALTSEVRRGLETLDLSLEQSMTLSPFQSSMVQGATRLVKETAKRRDWQARVLKNLTAAADVTRDAIVAEKEALGYSGIVTPELQMLEVDLTELERKIREASAALSHAEGLLNAMLAKEPEKSEESEKGTKKRRDRKSGSSAAAAANLEEGEGATAGAGAAAAAAISLARRVHKAAQRASEVGAGEEGAASSGGEESPSPGAGEEATGSPGVGEAASPGEKGSRFRVRWFSHFFGDSLGRKGRKKVRSAVGPSGGSDPAGPSTDSTRQRSRSVPAVRTWRRQSAPVTQGHGPESPGAHEGPTSRLSSAESGRPGRPLSSGGASVASGSEGSGRRRGRRARLRTGSEGSTAPPSSSPPPVPMVLVTPLPPRLVTTEEEVRDQLSALRGACAAIMHITIQSNTSSKDREAAFKDAVRAHSEAERVDLSPSLPAELRATFEHSKNFTWLAIVSLYKTLVPTWESRATALLDTLHGAGGALRRERKKVAHWTPSSAKEALLRAIGKCGRELERGKAMVRNIDFLLAVFPPSKERLIKLLTQGRKMIDKVQAQMIMAAMDCALLAEGVLQKRLIDSANRPGQEGARLVWFAYHEGDEVLRELKQLVHPLPEFKLEILLEQTRSMLKQMTEGTEAGLQQGLQREHSP